MRKPLFTGNWKMNKTQTEAAQLSLELKSLFAKYKDADIVIAPPFTSLNIVSETIKSSTIRLGAQNCHWEDSGAFTGEISPLMLKESGVEFAIIGHSERRQYFGETNTTVNRRTKNAIKNKLIPIICVGETKTERERGDALALIEKQVKESLDGLMVQNPAGIAIAYEPIWAIGTGMIATPEQIEDVHVFIRKTLRNLFGDEADGIRILYGGSVTSRNIKSFINRESVDGALVGGASLKAQEFFNIASSVNN
ncbi:MAG TPA: triose-phosphate isomerase [bacterium]